MGDNPLFWGDVALPGVCSRPPTRSRTRTKDDEEDEELFITIRLDERGQFFVKWLDEFLVIPPAPNRALEKRFGNLGVTWGADLFGLGMFVVLQYAGVPGDAEEIQDAPGGGRQVSHQFFVAHLEGEIAHSRQHRPPEAHDGG